MAIRRGNNRNNTLNGTSERDVIDGLGGHDVIRGGGGNDLIRGGLGNDRLFGEAGDDTIRGGAGIDAIRGGRGADVLFGNADDDRLFGQAGNDRLLGGPGNDTLNGGPGDDRLNGEQGLDILVGGPAADTLVFTALDGQVDRIAGFNQSQDRFDLAPALPTFRSGDDIADFVRFVADGQDTILQFDRDGGGDSFEAVARLLGVQVTSLPADRLGLDGTSPPPRPDPEPGNRAPTLARAIENITTEEGRVVRVRMDDHFRDPNPGDDPTYTIRQPNGGALPFWMRVQGDELVISPNEFAAGKAANVQVVATDEGGLTAQTTFRVGVRQRRPPGETEQSGDDANDDGTFAASNVSISEDGRFVGYVFRTDDRDEQLVLRDFVKTARGDPDDPSTFFVLASGTQDDGPAVYEGHTSLSADGRTIAAEFNDNGPQTVQVLRITNTSPLAIRTVFDEVPGARPVLSADGEVLAFERDGSIIVVKLATGQQDVIAGATEAGLSADGSRIVYHHRATGEVRVAEVDLASVTVRETTAEIAGRASFRLDDPDTFDANEGQSARPMISGDGTTVAFESDLALAGDTNPGRDVFVYDVQSNGLTIASRDAGGQQGVDLDAGNASLSADGQRVAFHMGYDVGYVSSANFRSLPGAIDIFVKDFRSGELRLVSVASDGDRGNGGLLRPALSADGRYVAFQGTAQDLAEGGDAPFVDHEHNVYLAPVNRGVLFDLPDFHPASRSGAVALGNEARGRIDSAGDQDWFEVVRPLSDTGDFTRFSTDGNHVLRIFDRGGREVAVGAPGGSVDLLRPGQADNYYVSVEGADGATGPYTITQIDRGDASDRITPDDGELAITLAAEATRHGVLESGDIDYFTFNDAAGQTVQVTLEVVSGATTGDVVDLRVRDALDAPITSAQATGEGGRATVSFETGAVGGTFYIVADGTETSSEVRYRLSATASATPPPGDDDIPATADGAVPLAPGDIRESTIDPATDRDWFAVDLEAGQQYQFDMRGASSDGGTLRDPLLRLLDSTGSPVPGAVADDIDAGNRDARLEFTPIDAGRYFLSAESLGDATGTYTLSAAPLAAPIALPDVLDDSPDILGSSASLQPAAANVVAAPGDLSSLVGDPNETAAYLEGGCWPTTASLPP